MNDTIQGLRSQLAQLQKKHQSGQLNAKAYAAAKVPLEQRLVQAVLAEAPSESPSQSPSEWRSEKPATTERPSRKLVASLIATVLVLAVSGYAWTGSPGAIGVAATAPAGPGATAPHGVDDQVLSAAVEKLALKLADKPDNPEGWAMLARSYAQLSRHAEAVPAFERALALHGEDARLLADYADTLAVRNNRSLQGEPTRLIERALALDPDQPKALALAGTAAFERRDFAAAVAAWERLARQSPAESTFMPQLESSIREARERAGLPATAIAGGPNAAASARAPGATATIAATTTAVQGRVSLSPGLAKLAGPDDTVFVFARAANGPRMPLAIVRRQVKDLPFSFTLDDSSAMTSAMRLSLHPQVVVAARISKTGQAAPASGDLIGQSAPVKHDARGVVVEIDEVVKP